MTIRFRVRTLTGVLICMVAMAMLATACQKDLPEGRLALGMEPMGGTKVAVDGSASMWTEGDEVRVNGVVAEVHVGDGSAYVDGVLSAQVYRALFPASLATASLTADEVEVQLPAVYHYRTAGGRQQIDLPMAARAASGERIEMKHLTGALYLTIANSTGVPLTLDSVIVASDRYLLSGSRTVQLGGLASLGAAEASNEADREVALTFDRERKVIDAGGEVEVLVPVAPVGSDNHFTITATAHYEGKRYTFSRQQSTGGALGRNVVGYVPIEMQASGTGMTTGELFQRANGESLIASPLDLMVLAEACRGGWKVGNSGNITYAARPVALVKDLDMEGYTCTPIMLTDKLNGNGHTIAHLTLEAETESGSCKCALLAGSSVEAENLTLEDVRLVCTVTGNGVVLVAGAFCADANSVKLTQCRVEGMVVSITGAAPTDLYMGGLAGQCKNATVTNCGVSGLVSWPTQTLTGACRVGGLIGYAAGASQTSRASVKLTHCTAMPTGEMAVSGSGVVDAGGLIGMCMNAVVEIKEGCTWEGDWHVVCGSTVGGGFVGRMQRNVTLTAAGSSAKGTIAVEATNTSASRLGWYVGRNLATAQPTIESSCEQEMTLMMNGEEVAGVAVGS